MQSVAPFSSDCQNSDLSRESSEGLRKGETGIEIQAGRCRFYKAAPSGSVNKGGGIRGKVKGMSDASRRRFMAKFASLDYAAMSAASVPLWFVTLTTPECFWNDVRFVYKSLRRFRDALEYSETPNGYLGAFVRRELGSKRGMLHYHLVIVGGDMKRFPVGDTWARSLRHEGKVRVDVQPLETAEKVAKYLSKYCSKVGYEGKERPSADPCVGACEGASGAAEDAPLSKAHTVGNPQDAYTGQRWWSVWGEETLPWGEVVTILGDQAKEISKSLRRIFRRWRVQKEVQRIDRQFYPGFATKHFTIKQLRKSDSFGEFMRRAGGGFTILLSPGLLERMIDAASMACAGQEA